MEAKKKLKYLSVQLLCMDVNAGLVLEFLLKVKSERLWKSVKCCDVKEAASDKKKWLRFRGPIFVIPSTDLPLSDYCWLSVLRFNFSFAYCLLVADCYTRQRAYISDSSRWHFHCYRGISQAYRAVQGAEYEQAKYY